MYNILVIEDNESDILMTKFLLSQYGYEADFATNAYDADEKLLKNNYHLILIDWNLPHMSGIDYLRRIKRLPKKREIPIIMVSARSEPKDVKMALKEGVSDYIIKPIEPSTLQKKIKKYLQTLEYYSPVELPQDSLDNSGQIRSAIKLTSLSPTEISFQTSMQLVTNATYNIEFNLFKKISIPELSVKVQEIKEVDDYYEYKCSIMRLTSEQYQKLKIIHNTLYSMRTINA